MAPAAVAWEWMAALPCAASPAPATELTTLAAGLGRAAGVAWSGGPSTAGAGRPSRATQALAGARRPGGQRVSARDARSAARPGAVG